MAVHESQEKVEDGKSSVSMSEAFRVWLRVALLSFDGPAGQIAVMHRIIVEEKKWINDGRFRHALSYCMLLPRPEAQQLATYIGWLMHRTAGGLTAGILFVIPWVVSVMAVSIIYALYGKVGFVSDLFFGLKAAVLAIVLRAVVRVGTKALKNRVMVALAAAAFSAIFFAGIPFPIIIFAAGLIGFVRGRRGAPAFQVGGENGASGSPRIADSETLLGESLPEHARPTVGELSGFR